MSGPVCGAVAGSLCKRLGPADDLFGKLEHGPTFSSWKMYHMLDLGDVATVGLFVLQTYSQ